MTGHWFLLVGILAIIVFIGGLMGAFRAGEESEISKYGYIENDKEENEDKEK